MVQVVIINQRGQRGFTLIELMIAGLIASMLVILLMSVVIMSSRTTATQEQAVSAVGRAYGAMDVIRSDLERVGFGMGLEILLFFFNGSTPVRDFIKALLSSLFDIFLFQQ